MWPFKGRDQKAYSLLEKGLAWLEEGESDKALAIAAKLEKAGFSGSFELRYRAHLLEKDRKSALRVLEEGLREAPQAGSLWQLLGVHHSDDAEWARAREAFGKALECPNMDPSWIHSDLAVVEQRAGDPEAARRHLAQVQAPEWASFAQSLEIQILNDEERFEEAIRAGRDWLEKQRDEEDRSRRAEEHAKVALACWRATGEREAAEEELTAALALDKQNWLAAQLLLEMTNEHSDRAMMWKLLVAGTWHGLVECRDKKTRHPGFLATYWVVADDETEALRFAARFEPPEVRDSLTISEAEALEPAGERLKGVHFARGGYVFHVHTGKD